MKNELKNFKRSMTSIHEMFRQAECRMAKTFSDYHEYYEEASYLSHASDAFSVEYTYVEYLAGRLNAYYTRKRLSQIRDNIVKDYYGNEFEKDACRELVKLLSDIWPQD